MMAYYNENDPYAAQWLRNLVDKGLLPRGDVDERSIVEVQPDDLWGYNQCHFFAGIGGWPYALQLAGWGERPVWTGSCPCQPFSSAGRQKAQQDARHLWPVWFRLIAAKRPSVLFGEQVAAAIAHGWLDDAFDDLEREGYETAAAVLPACSVGAPHKRDRLWFVANSEKQRYPRGEVGNEVGEKFPNGSGGKNQGLRLPITGDESSLQSLANANQSGSQGRDSAELPERAGEQSLGQRGTPEATLGISDSTGRDAGKQASEITRHRNTSIAASPDASLMADTTSAGLFSAAQAGVHSGEESGRSRNEQSERCGFWESEPAVGRVANGIPARVGRLRAYGNAIVPQVAQAFIESFMECRP